MVKLAIACDDYSTLEYRAAYEFISYPQTRKVKTRQFEMKFKGLENGTKYQFKVRGVNKDGKGPWSDVSQEVMPQAVPRCPVDLRCVPGNGEVSLYWVADDMSDKSINGWFEVSSKPQTYTMFLKRQQATFRNLVNETPYEFRVYAVNSVGRSRPITNEKIKPKESIKPLLYKRLQTTAFDHFNETREVHFKRQREKAERQKRSKEKAKKGVVSAFAAQLQQQAAKEKEDIGRAKRIKKEAKERKKQKEKVEKERKKKVQL